MDIAIRRLEPGMAADFFRCFGEGPGCYIYRKEL